MLNADASLKDPQLQPFHLPNDQPVPDTRSLARDLSESAGRKSRAGLLPYSLHSHLQCETSGEVASVRQNLQGIRPPITCMTSHQTPATESDCYRARPSCYLRSAFWSAL